MSELHLAVYGLMGEATAARKKLEATPPEPLTLEEQATAIAWTRWCRRSAAPFAALLMARDTRDRELGDKAYAELERVLAEVLG